MGTLSSYVDFLGLHSCLLSSLKCTGCGPWATNKVVVLNILPASTSNKLKFSLKMAFMFLAIIIKWQVPDGDIFLLVGKKGYCCWLCWQNSRSFICRSKLAIKLRSKVGSYLLPSLVQTEVINLLMNLFNSAAGISLIFLSSSFIFKNLSSNLTSLSVFWAVFLFSFSRINSLTEKTGTNLP